MLIYLSLVAYVFNVVVSVGSLGNWFLWHVTSTMCNIIITPVQLHSNYDYLWHLVVCERVSIQCIAVVLLHCFGSRAHGAS